MFILLFFTIVFYCSFAQSNIDVLHYKFEIELSDRSDTFKGRAFVTCNSLRQQINFGLNLFHLMGKGKGMAAYQVKENNENLSTLRQR